jgi:hypothetical protein
MSLFPLHIVSESPFTFIPKNKNVNVSQAAFDAAKH